MDGNRAAELPSEKIARFLADECPPTPCLVVDLDILAENYRRFEQAFPFAAIYYAVKANPAPEVLAVLSRLGARFDAASIHEVEDCLSLGIEPGRLSYGSTVKKSRDIASAFADGIRLFAFDSEAELLKLAKSAPGAEVFCRIITSGAGADWPLSRKFGCELDMAAALLGQARSLGLDPGGVSFHVGSQQRDPGQWDVAIGQTARLFTRLEAEGIELRSINLGGGFPARYRWGAPPLGAYAASIESSLSRHFGNHRPEIILEPGRSIVGDAGSIRSEIVLISRKGYGSERRRWIYLDIGKFGGLPETIGEAIQYRLKTPHDGKPKGPVVLAGPSCDEVDILYEEAGYELPLDLAIGDPVDILSAGAYTASYASVGFNGFAPLKQYFV
ncbi:MAG: type III PLP-dependent enzyme [Alphaproteobacteria bacterium]